MSPCLIETILADPEQLQKLRDELEILDSDEGVREACRAYLARLEQTDVEAQLFRWVKEDH